VSVHQLCEVCSPDIVLIQLWASRLFRPLIKDLFKYVVIESHFRPKGTTVHDVLLVSQVTGFYIAPFPGYQYWYWYWSKFLLWTGVYAILTPPFGVNP